MGAVCAALAVFALATGLAAVGLMEANRGGYESVVNPDPQGDDQQWEATV